jgi:hypothetical protein
MLKPNDKYTDESGTVWETYRDYCNSDALDFDIKCVMLETGRRTPQNEWEREYVKKTSIYKEKGIATELPFD